MTIGYLSAWVRTVPELLADPRYDGGYVAVSGVFYRGEELPPGDLALLPKDGWFDGTGLLEVRVPARETVLLLDDPDIHENLREIPGAVGGFWYKEDCVAVGRFLRGSRQGYGARIVDLQLLLLQSWKQEADEQMIRLIQFPQHSHPPLPWDSGVNPYGITILSLRASPAVADPRPRQKDTPRDGTEG
jgi:hypothetical protein